MVGPGDSLGRVPLRYNLMVMSYCYQHLKFKRVSLSREAFETNSAGGTTKTWMPIFTPFHSI